MAEVFVSYNQKNRALIEPIGARLAALGFNVWYDREIDPAEGFGAALRARLREAKVVLVCWSPEAVESEWVSGEAEYAIDTKNYVPIYIRPCLLMPPFNRIQTEDLSGWADSASDSAWLKLVERISKMIGREGVAAAAKAYAAGNEKALYDFARRYPEEPAAKRIWSEAEARHRSEFQSCLEEARATLAARRAQITADAAELQSSLDGQTVAFEAWLADERRGAAAKPRPDPLAIVRRFVPAEEKKLQEEVAALSSALAQAKGVEEELEAKKGEVARLSEQLTEKSEEVNHLRAEFTQQLEMAKAEVTRLLGELNSHAAEQQRLRDEIASLRSAPEEAKAKGKLAEEQLEAANTKIVQLSAGLEVERQRNNVPPDAQHVENFKLQAKPSIAHQFVVVLLLSLSVGVGTIFVGFAIAGNGTDAFVSLVIFLICIALFLRSYKKL